MTGKLEWFAGNEHGLRMYSNLCELAHIWDDLVDQDKEITEARVNRAFFIALVELPANPLYARLQGQLLPFWVATISSYAVANKWEREKDEHGLELGHTLRHMGVELIGYVVYICGGPEHAERVMPEVWKDIVPERFKDYRKEFINEKV